MSGKKYILKSFLVLHLVMFMGCISIGKFGKADVTYFEIKTPAELNGQSKADIIKVLGLPDINVKAGGNEYWGYKNKRGFFIILFGKTEEKDLVLVFKGDKVTSNYLVDKGSSTGIIAPPGAVAN